MSSSLTAEENEVSFLTQDGKEEAQEFFDNLFLTPLNQESATKTSKKPKLKKLRTKAHLTLIVCINIILLITFLIDDYTHFFTSNVLQNPNLTLKTQKYLIQYSGVGSALGAILSPLFTKKGNFRISCVVGLSLGFTGILMMTLGVVYEVNSLLFVGNILNKIGFGVVLVFWISSVGFWFSRIQLTLVISSGVVSSCFGSLMFRIFRLENIFENFGNFLIFCSFASFFCFLFGMIYFYVEIQLEKRKINRLENDYNEFGELGTYCLDFYRTKKILKSTVITFILTNITLIIWKNIGSKLVASKFSLNQIEAENQIEISLILPLIITPLWAFAASRYGHKPLYLTFSAALVSLMYTTLFLLSPDTQPNHLSSLFWLFGLAASINQSVAIVSVILNSPKEIVPASIGISVSASILFSFLISISVDFVDFNFSLFVIISLIAVLSCAITVMADRKEGGVLRYCDDELIVEIKRKEWSHLVFANRE